eukprot:UN01040
MMMMVVMLYTWHIKHSVQQIKLRSVHLINHHLENLSIRCNLAKIQQQQQQSPTPIQAQQPQQHLPSTQVLIIIIMYSLFDQIDIHNQARSTRLNHTQLTEIVLE